MGKFRNQTRNLKRNKVAVTVNKVRKMKKEAKLARKDGEGDVLMGEDTPKVRGLAVKSIEKLKSGELKNVPKVNERKILRKTELPVRENKKILDVPSGKRGTTAQYITKKKARKMYKQMTLHARETFRKMQENGEIVLEGDVDMES